MFFFLNKFLCCMPLSWGVIFIGVSYGTVNFLAGTAGCQMVIGNEYDDDLIEFFRNMPINYCVAGFSTVFYLLATINFLVAYGAYTANQRFIGIWLLVHFTEFLLTLVSAMMGTAFLIHIVAVGYALLVVKSYYATLIREPWAIDMESSESSDDYEDEV